MKQVDFPPCGAGVHCHVNAGPTRTEQMDEQTIQSVLDFLAAANISTLDITGGAPELHPRFRHLVLSARKRGARVIDRCNLTRRSWWTGSAARESMRSASVPCAS